jgi:hypothetical protein
MFIKYIVENDIKTWYYYFMKINKNSAYLQVVREIPLFIVYVIMVSILCIALKSVFMLLISYMFSIMYLIVTVITNSHLADIELFEDYFLVITFFKINKTYYNDFFVNYVYRNRRPIAFIIEANNKKIKLSYSENNYNNIKILLTKVKTKYSVNNFQNVIDNYSIKPGFFDY